MSQDVSKQNIDEYFTKYLDFIFNKGEDTYEFLYLDKIKSLNLDYSSQSIDKIDKFLNALRDQTKPDREDFFLDSKKRNILYLFSFYICSYMTNRYGVALKWLNIKEATKLAPKLPQSYEYSVACIMDNELYAPLAIVANRLFDPERSLSCRDFVDKTVSKFKNKIARIPNEVNENELRKANEAYQLEPASSFFGLFKKQNVGPKDFPIDWLLSMALAGRAARLAISFALNEAPIAPSVFVNTTAIDFSFQKNPMNSAVDYYKKNPEKHPQLAFFFKQSVNLPIGLRDAVTIETKSIGNNNMNASIMVPYVAATDKREFVVLRPVLVGTSIKEAYYPILYAAFNSGMDFGEGFDWSRYLKQDDLKVFIN